MDFFNEVSKKFSSVARSVSEKTKESVEVTRLTGDLRNARNELEQLYNSYGKACYALREGEGDAKTADGFADQIRVLLGRIEDLSNQRDELKDVRRCPGCGAVQPRDARFCSSCGKRMPEDAPEVKPDPDREYCPFCGAEKEPESRFCRVCGKTFGIEEETPDAPTGEQARPIDSIDAEEPAGEDATDGE